MPSVSIFQIINISLIALVLFFLIKYLWSIFFDKNYQPVVWTYKIKSGEISKELIRLEKNHPDKVRFF
ncbi:MAG: hypothetical protein KAT33_01760, partial [Bacteroidales bacterium]|nr:hypothetical protein [Bacteroidales bacterium]